MFAKENLLWCTWILSFCSGQTKDPGYVVSGLTFPLLKSTGSTAGTTAGTGKENEHCRRPRATISLAKFWPTGRLYLWLLIPLKNDQWVLSFTYKWYWIMCVLLFITVENVKYYLYNIWNILYHISNSMLSQKEAFKTFTFIIIIILLLFYYCISSYTPFNIMKTHLKFFFLFFF